MDFLSIQLSDRTEIHLSTGEHGALVREIQHEFAPRFAPGSALICVGNASEEVNHLYRESLAKLRVPVDQQHDMPDVVNHDACRNRLYLIETATGHGPIDGNRRDELAARFAGSSASLIYFTDFPTRAVMARHLAEIAWKFDVWVADAPEHMIHFVEAWLLGPRN